MTLLRRQLARRLRELRQAAGKTVTDVATSGLASQVKLWRIETAKVPVKVGDVYGLCLLYGANPDLLVRWALAAGQPGWWEDFDEAGPTSDGLCSTLEAAAHHLYVYDGRRIPDLLHTRDYARAQYLAVEPDAADAAVRDYLDHQQERQAELLRREPPTRLTAIVDENALTRPVGGPDCMRGQIRRLRDLADHVHIDLRYLPSQVGTHPAMRSAGFTILDFIDNEDPDVVYLETLTGARYLERPTEVTRYRRIFTSVYALSVPISDFTETT